MKTKDLTLCIVVNENKILLGFKKRGFGEGLWNGFGGKLDDGESVENAVRRELKEEASIEVEKILQLGQINFTFDDTPDEILCVHIYRGEGVLGEPCESEEMKPQWFHVDDIPYESMWPDDIFWLPKFLEGKAFSGAFHFDVDRNITKHSLSIEGEE